MKYSVFAPRERERERVNGNHYSAYQMRWDNDF